MKSILVTGGAGYIGSAVVSELRKAGMKPVVFDNLSSGKKEAVADGVPLIRGDLNDGETLLKAFKKHSFEVVVHCSGLSALSASLETPGRYYQSVISGGVNLLEAMIESGCKRILCASSCAVYGLPEKMPVDERAPVQPVTPAGHATLVYEQILEWYKKVHEIDYSSLRIFNVSGATADQGEWVANPDRLLSRIFLVVAGAEEFVPIYGDGHATPDGTCIRDYLHIGDLARGVEKALVSETGGIFNFGSGEGYSVNQVLDCARKITGHDIPVRVLPERPGDVPRLVAACHRAKMNLEWTPEFRRIQDIVESASKWAEAHPEIYQPS